MDAGKRFITGKEAPSMGYCYHGGFRQPFRQQFQFLKRQFLQDDALPFGDVLSEQGRRPGTHRPCRRLDRPHLFAAGDVVGFSGSGSQC